MSQIKEIIQGLQILSRYRLQNDWIAAEHDIIYGPDLKEDVTPEDAKQLENLGWFFDEEFDCWAVFTENIKLTIF